jgi:CRP-like cAMP-binding protein
MEEKNFGLGEAVIRQGEAGNVLFVVDEGELDCYKEMVSDLTIWRKLNGLSLL